MRSLQQTGFGILDIKKVQRQATCMVHGFLKVPHKKDRQDGGFMCKSFVSLADKKERRS